MSEDSGATPLHPPTRADKVVTVVKIDRYAITAKDIPSSLYSSDPPTLPEITKLQNKGRLLDTRYLAPEVTDIHPLLCPVCLQPFHIRGDGFRIIPRHLDSEMVVGGFGSINVECQDKCEVTMATTSRIAKFLNSNSSKLTIPLHD
jgi:hypothetical protein